MEDTLIQKATLQDIKRICDFTDFWLAGRGMRFEAPGAVNDYFISPSQHKRYIEKYRTYIVRLDEEIIAWSVIQTDGTMIHLLVSGRYRHIGIGSCILKKLSPKKNHSKSNQSSGNPGSFYESQGYTKTDTIKARRRVDVDKIDPDRKPIIDIYQKVS